MGYKHEHMEEILWHGQGSSLLNAHHILLQPLLYNAIVVLFAQSQNLGKNFGSAKDFFPGKWLIALV